MNINTNNIVPISEANQNFSKAARLVDENGYDEQFADDEDVLAVSKRLLEKNHEAYEILAK